MTTTMVDMLVITERTGDIIEKCIGRTGARTRRSSIAGQNTALITVRSETCTPTFTNIIPARDMITMIGVAVTDRNRLLYLTPTRSAHANEHLRSHAGVVCARRGDNFPWGSCDAEICKSGT